VKVIIWLILGIMLSVSFAAPASARSASTRCVEALSNQTISGNLIVPAGEQCALINSTILGDIRVEQRATLEVIGSRINGTLTGSRFELVTLRDASVNGRVRLTGGSAVELERSTAGGDVRIVDQVDVRVLQSRVTGRLVVRDAAVTLLCGSTVEGDARFADHRGGLLIGDVPPFLPPCSANEVWGNLRVHHNASETIIANTTVGRNLICAANDPAPLVYGNQVGGKARGQCGLNEPVDITELNENAE
jgi:hypothetical protein